MIESPSLQFLGAAGTVTGSKYLIGVGARRILLDCGLFQGLKELRLRNWRPAPFQATDVDAVVLTHAHIDHSGYLPLLARNGFRGPVYCTSGTAELLGLLLVDSAHLQEEDAERANRRGYTKHKPALPLYTTADAEAALKLIQARSYETPFQVTDGVAATLRRAGHILGSATVELQLGEANPLCLVSSGDLGRWGRPILRDPEPVSEADVLLVESTYGDRVHDADVEEPLVRIVQEVAARGGVLVVPAFAVGRTQELVWRLRLLEDAGRIPELPVYLDSPMAIDVTEIYCRHPEDHNLDMKELMDEKRCPLRSKQIHFARTPDESKTLNRIAGPAIIISASGMATGGRILHHLKQRLPDVRTMVLLVGYQAAGTRGRSLQDGAKHVRIHGADVPVRARIETLHGLSAHADRNEILRWLSEFRKAPRQTYIVHGEPKAAEGLAEIIQNRLGWPVAIARDGETIHLQM